MSEGIVDGMGWTRANIHLESLHLVRKTTVAETHTVGPKRGGTHVGFRTSPTTTDALRHRGYTTDVSSPLVSSSSVVRQLSPRRLYPRRLFVSCPTSVVRQFDSPTGCYTRYIINEEGRVRRWVT